MGRYVTLQEQLTVSGDTSSGDFFAGLPLEDALDVSRWHVAFVSLHTLSVDVTGDDEFLVDIGTLDAPRTSGVEPVPDGAVGPCASFDSLGSEEWHKALVGLGDEPQGTGTYPIENRLGWHMDLRQGSGGGGAFSVTFEIFVTLKRRSS